MELPHRRGEPREQFDELMEWDLFPVTPGTQFDLRICGNLNWFFRFQRIIEYELQD